MISAKDFDIVNRYQLLQFQHPQHLTLTFSPCGIDTALPKVQYVLHKHSVVWIEEQNIIVKARLMSPRYIYAWTTSFIICGHTHAQQSLFHAHSLRQKFKIAGL
ncbi:hypothetical protein AMECASPLE_032481 [Ameca splendens]|uniref:Uncharacterized protein n=1 Tax=Ameca splendens TaxID=208324 RepID=A0ABV0ZFD1_9TELE